jgi:hypothetical protein
MSQATGASSVAIGDNAVANKDGSLALGLNSQATALNSVAIGSGSIANAPNTVSVGAFGAERRVTNVAPGINGTDAVNVNQLTSTAAGLQNQINNVDNRLRDGVAVAMATGGVPSVPTGRRFGVFGNIAGYDGHGAAGFGITGVLMDGPGYQVQANGSFGVGFDTNVVGARGGVAVFW